MTDIKPGVNEPDTLSDEEFLARFTDRVDAFITLTGKQLEHLDVQAHETASQVAAIHAFIEEHRPAIARATGLLDTGARMRGFLKGKTGD